MKKQRDMGFVAALEKIPGDVETKIFAQTRL
jgi:hypothetical protein